LGVSGRECAVGNEPEELLVTLQGIGPLAVVGPGFMDRAGFSQGVNRRT
jgi:hypothetical protein